MMYLNLKFYLKFISILKLYVLIKIKKNKIIISVPI